MTLRFLALIALAIIAFLSSSSSVSSSSDLRDVPRCKCTHDVAQTLKVRAYQSLAIEAQSERSPRIATLSNDVFDASPFPANDALQKDHVLLFGRGEFNFIACGALSAATLAISLKSSRASKRVIRVPKSIVDFSYNAGAQVVSALQTRNKGCKSFELFPSVRDEKTDSNAIAGETLVKES